MRMSDITQLLDREFRIGETADPGMTNHALTDSGRGYVLPAFQERKTGLMFDFGESVNMVYCVTFTTGEALSEILKTADGPAMIFTHHPFDYHEDERGLTVMDDRLILELKKRRLCVYAIHAPLDVGQNICVSKSLAKRIGLCDPRPFFPALGGYLGMFGHMGNDSFKEMAKTVGQALNLDTVDLFDNGGKEELVAVVAGGGDQTKILKAAIERGCSTYITGTVVHRWNREAVQKGNQDFHQLARTARVNLIGGTHYTTEKWAVQDIALFLQGKGIRACFIEDPELWKYDKGNFRI